MARVAELQADTQKALEAALAARALPGTALTQAGTLLERLQTATRVTLVGQPGSGKSAILNLLAGQDFVPLGLKLCTLQLVYGPAQRATVTLRDGSNLTMEGTVDFNQIASMSPAFLKIEAPLPALNKISILEVVTSEDRLEQIRALAWASQQTDIAIWCTQDYDAAEQTLWSEAPDTVKDHAILIRTQADLLGENRNSAIAALSREAGPDFGQVMAVSAKEAQSARDNPGGVDKAAMKNSGAMGLISTILRKIENGRQHAVDQAEILLHKHQGYVPTAEDKQDAQTEAPVKAEEQPAVQENPVAEPKAQPEPAVQEAPTPEQKVEAAPEPEQPTPADVEPVAEQPAKATSETETADIFDFKVAADNKSESAEDSSGAIRTLCEEATSRLQKTGTDLAKLDDVSPKAVLNRAADDIVWLSEHLAEADVPKNDSMKKLNTWVRDAEDLIQLLRIEGGDDSATDAVTTLLQLKRSFQAQLAA